METIKVWLQKLAYYYKTNAKFHSFVYGIEIAVSTALVTYSGGWPTSKNAWIALISFVGGIAYRYVRQFIADALAKTTVQTSPVATTTITQRPA